MEEFFFLIMSDTTNIMDLPTDPVGGGNISNNISLSVTEQRIPNADFNSQIPTQQQIQGLFYRLF